MDDRQRCGINKGTCTCTRIHTHTHMGGVEGQRPRWCEDPTHDHTFPCKQLPVQDVSDAAAHSEAVGVGHHDGVMGEHTETTPYSTTTHHTHTHTHTHTQSYIIMWRESRSDNTKS